MAVALMGEAWNMAVSMALTLMALTSDLPTWLLPVVGTLTEATKTEPAWGVAAASSATASRAAMRWRH